jgi:hypothetical protein
MGICKYLLVGLICYNIRSCSNDDSNSNEHVPQKYFVEGRVINESFPVD